MAWRQVLSLRVFSVSLIISIICCEKPIFREILDENAFFYSLGIGNLERAVEEWRKLPRDKIPDSRKVALYSWEDMAKDLLALVL